MSKPTDQALSELRKVDRLSTRRKNKSPKELALIVSSSSLHQEATDPLLRQVEVAKEYDKQDWLHSWLDSYQFHSREWISRNISPLASAKKHTWEEKPTGTSKDIRLDSDPTIERTGEHLSPETELLLEGEECSMEVDLVEAEKLISLSLFKDSDSAVCSNRQTPVYQGLLHPHTHSAPPRTDPLPCY